MTSNRILRLTAAAILCISVVWALLPYVTSYVSTSAVVNAPLITIRSPIDGHVAVASPDVAEPVVSGEGLATIEADLLDRTLLEELMARATQLSAQLDAIATQSAALDAVRTDLGARGAQLQAQMSVWLEARRNEVSASLAGAVAERDETAERAERSRTLNASGAVTEAALRRDEAELASAEAAVSLLRAQLETAAREEEALEQGVLVQSGTQGASYSRQRLDEVALRIAEVEVERSKVAAERASFAARIAEARREIAAREVFAPVASASGVVWRASGAPGAAVLAGDEVLQVLDCERRFIEVAVSERHFEAIRPGAVARVQFRGSSARLPATVSAVRGSGAKFNHPQLAAETPHVGESQLRVLLRLDEASLPGPADRQFCDVGRTAEVRFGRSLAGSLPGVPSVMRWLGGADRDAAVDVAAAP